MTQYHAPLLMDVYKSFHVHAYKEGITHVFSNFTNRHGKYSNVPQNAEVMHVGLQYFILDVLIKGWNETFFNQIAEVAVNEYRRVISGILGKDVDVDHLYDLHELGYLPVEIRAVEEGTLVPYGVPSLTIVNTVEGFGWLTNMLETVMSAELWGIQTSATTAFAYRKRFEQELSLDKEMIPFMGHDFSYRGMFGTQAASMSGFGHLCSFLGSDTIPAGLFAEKYYGAKIGSEELVMTSVPATEHSVMTSYGQDQEQGSLLHLMEEVCPSGILSIVSDSWDFWKLVTEYLPELKDVIMSRDGTVVIRPDSGDPVDILCGTGAKAINFDGNKYVTDFDSFKSYVQDDLHEVFCDELNEDCTNPISEMGQTYTFQGKLYEVVYEPDLNRHDKTYYFVDNYGSFNDKFTWTEIEATPESKGLIECLWDTFGGTINDDGMKVLDSHIGAIYGDSITLERQDQIIKKLVAKGFVPSVVLGIGSFTYQYVTRDTHGSAVKATDVQFGTGNHQPIFKDPKTDKSKKSAKGLLKVVNVDGRLTLQDNVTMEEFLQDDNELQPIFKNGVLVKETSLKEIREVVNSQL